MLGLLILAVGTFLLVLGQKGSDVMSEVLQFPYHAAAEAGQFGSGKEHHGVDTCELSVHIGHLQFVFIVFQASYAAQDGAGTASSCCLAGQVAVGHHLHAFLLLVDGPYYLLPLCHILCTTLLFVVANGNDHAVEEPQSTLYDISMSLGKGIEAAGEKNRFQFTINKVIGYGLWVIEWVIGYRL